MNERNVMTTAKIKTNKPDTASTESTQSSAKTGTRSKNSMVKLEDSVLISVKSNVYGRLIYIDKKYGDLTEWSRYGDIQQMTMASLRSMKSSQRNFFENIWITIQGVYDEGYENITPEDIYNSLQVQQYYKEILCPSSLESVLRWSADEIAERVPLMANGAKVSLAVLANTCIENGTLDSLSKIHALETALNCELEIK